jgi:dihydropyrimidinase
MNNDPLLIISGTHVSASSTVQEDIAVSDGKIKDCGILDPNYFPGYEIIDAAGKLVFPGGIDSHVHFALPTPAGNSSDDFRSGSIAALAGGTTSFIDFVTPRRGQSLLEALQQRKAEALSSLAGYQLHMGISEWNSRIASEIISCIEKEGIRSFKTYLAYQESIGINLSDLRQVMEVAGPAGGLVMVHCEDGKMIRQLQQEFIREGKTRALYHSLSHPPEAEIRAVNEVIGLSAKTNCPVYIVHTSTYQGAQAIREAKKAGLPVFGETCPQYLLLNDSVYYEKSDNPGVLPYVMSPPLRKAIDQDYLWRGLSDGTFDTVATDHCPFNLFGQKDLGSHDFTKIPNGAGGVEHRLTLLYTYGVLSGKITMNKFVDLVSTRPAEIFGMADCKGKLDPGYDADIVIWDPDYQGSISAKTHFQHCDSDIYEGFSTRGRPEMVILGGKIVIQNGKFVSL